jgi:predicted transcriptional regulator
MPKIIENQIIKAFKERNSFDRDELYHFYLDFEPDLKKSTFSWRIYDLKKKDIIKTIGRGLYVISYKPKYKPVLTENALKIARKTSERFEDIIYCIWESQWLNEFTQHQTSNQMIVVEVEKEFTESLYYFLNDSLRMDFFLNPDEKEIQFYISESTVPVVIKRLVTRAPISKLKDKKTTVPIATLEKIMVDLFADENLFHFYQGSELIYIFERILNRYSINLTKLFSYAKRRKKEQEIKQFISKHIPNFLEDIQYD